MTEHVIVEGEAVEVDEHGVALERYEARPPATLFGTNDPVLVIEKATKVATALADLIDRQNLSMSIQNKKYVKVEGWTVLGSMLGVFPVLRECEPVEIDGIKGYRATVDAKTIDGNVVGSATAFCMRNESRWGRAETYAIASMAQTRATSKALRIPLGFVMQIAGYDPTPAEEREGVEPGGVAAEQGGREAAPGGATPAPQEAQDSPVPAGGAPRPNTREWYLAKLRDGIILLSGTPGWSEAEICANASAKWHKPVETLDDLTMNEMKAVLEGMRTYGGVELT